MTNKATQGEHSESMGEETTMGIEMEHGKEGHVMASGAVCGQRCTKKVCVSVQPATPLRSEYNQSAGKGARLTWAQRGLWQCA